MTTLDGRPVRISLVSRLGREDVTGRQDLLRHATAEELKDPDLDLLVVLFRAADREGKAVEVASLETGAPWR